MSDETAIEAAGLMKSYGDVKVLSSGVDLRVRRGSVFALLGPRRRRQDDRSGILRTLAAADGGRARVAGHDVVAARRPRAAQHQPHRPVRRARRGADRRGEPADDGTARGPAAR